MDQERMKKELGRFTLLWYLGVLVLLYLFSLWMTRTDPSIFMVGLVSVAGMALWAGGLFTGFYRISRRHQRPGWPPAREIFRDALRYPQKGEVLGLMLRVFAPFFLSFLAFVAGINELFEASMAALSQGASGTVVWKGGGLIVLGVVGFGSSFWLGGRLAKRHKDLLEPPV